MKIKYTPYFQWVSCYQPSNYRVGLTDFAQQLLGEIVYVELPNVGDKVVKNQPCCCVESRKSVVDILAPCSGKVIAINSQLLSTPQLINHSSEHSGWMFAICLADLQEWHNLLDMEPQP
jgi:glycine cleavage system H protein